MSNRSGRKVELVESFLPSAGIEWDVIKEDIKLYLGPEATVEFGTHRKDPRIPGYWMKARGALTTAMISDLKADSIRWRQENAVEGGKAYAETRTHQLRREIGPTRPALQPAAPYVERAREEPASRRPEPMLSRTEAEQIILRRLPSNERQQTSKNLFERQVDQLLNKPSITRNEAEKIIAQRLKDRGDKGITRTQFDALIEKMLGSGSQATSQSTQMPQSAPPPYDYRDSSDQPDNKGTHYSSPPDQPNQPGTFGHRG